MYVNHFLSVVSNPPKIRFDDFFPSRNSLFNFSLPAIITTVVDSHFFYVVIVVLDGLLVDVLEHVRGDANVDLAPVKVLIRRRLGGE